MTKPDIQQYLDLAHEDVQAAYDNLQMGHIRVAASRSYYAMFYAATALLASQGIWRSKHQGVIAALGEYFVKPGLLEPEYGRALSDAFNARLSSDYTPLPLADDSATRQLVEKAETFVNRIVQLLKEMDSVQVDDEIQ